MKNIEKIMKFCSKLNDIFEYPYYFNWSAPTNHKDDSPYGELKDLTYVIFRVGKYHPTQIISTNNRNLETDRICPTENQLFFGQISLITSFKPFEFLLNEEYNSDIKINNFDELILYKDKLKNIFDKLLVNKTNPNDITSDELKELKYSVFNLCFDLSNIDKSDVMYHFNVIRDITKINNITDEILNELCQAFFKPIK